jgi:hypothetical protein
MKKARLIAFIAILLSLGQAALYARGQEAIDLSYADKLIDERKYNEAMTYLKEYMVRYPKYWEEAQKRVGRIIKKREAYNSISAELIKLLQTDPGNEKRKIELIRQLQDIEANPNESQEEFLRRIEATAVFKVNQAAYDDIFKRGRALIDSGDYVKATKAYAEGYVLYKEGFDSAGSGSLVVGTVNQGLADIDRCLADFEAVQQQLQGSSAVLEKAILTDAPEALGTAIDANLEPLAKLIKLRNDVASRGRLFESQFALLQAADPSLTDTSFLPFAFRFTLGRKTQSAPEGIMGAMDTQLGRIMESLESKLSLALDRGFESMQSAYDAGRWDESEADARDVIARADQSMRLISLWSLVAAREAYPELQGLGRDILSGKAAIALGFQHMQSAAKIYARAAAILKERERLAAQSGQAATPAMAALSSKNANDAAQASAAIQALRAQSAAQRALLAAAARESDSVKLSFGAYGQPGRVGAVTPVGYGERQSDLDRRISIAQGAMLDTEIEMARQSASIDSGLIAAGLGDDESGIRRAGALITGEASTDPGLENRVICDPAGSLDMASRIEQGLESKQAKLTAILAKYAKLDSFIVASDAYKAWKVQADAIDLRIAGLISSAVEMTRLARTKKQQADSAKADADRLLAEAAANLKSENFSIAEDRLKRASARYENSLAAQWDAKLKTESDRAVDDLDGRIVTAKRNKIVKNVRGFINAGTDAYYSGAFENSQESFTQAQQQWLTVYPEENVEVATWLDRITNAVKFRSGRVIQPTAPLYSEMSQLLSQAQIAYNEGKAGLDKGKKTEALAAFKLAESKVQQVKIVFPNNQDASILMLRIKLLSDKDVADKLSKQFFADAEKKLDRKTQPTWEDGYNDLLTLKSVNPKYSGIDAAIFNAELQLGYRLPPPKASDISRSRDLAANAKSIMDNRNKLLYPDALNYLNQAIALWPQNTQAQGLIDLLQQGGSVTAPEGKGFTPSDNVLYQKAVVLYNKGQYLESRAIVDKLLAIARNKQNAQLLALNKKIEEALTK